MESSNEREPKLEELTLGEPKLGECKLGGPNLWELVLEGRRSCRDGSKSEFLGR